VQLLSDGDGHGDLEGVDVVERDERADVVVLGGACEAFSYAAINRVFQQVMDGAALVGMHRNLYWRTSEGLQLDGGAFIAGIEVAAAHQHAGRHEDDLALHHGRDEHGQVGQVAMPLGEGHREPALRSGPAAAMSSERRTTADTRSICRSVSEA
jgi:hypothetical protein